MTAGEIDRRKQLVAGVFLLALTLMNARIVVLGAPSFLRDGREDFSVFYRQAEMIRCGQAARLQDMHPPFEVLLFVPFTYVNFMAAYLLWTFLNVTMMAVSLGMVRGMFGEVGGLNRLLVVLAATGFAPAVRAILQGQDSVLLLFLVSLGLWLLTRGNDAWAGAALGAGLFKFHIVIPLALVLAVRRPRLLVGLGSVGGALAAISAMMLGWHGLAGYVQFVLRTENHGAGGTAAAAMPNLHGLIAEFAGKSDGGGATVPAIIRSIAGSTAGSIAGSIAILGIALLLVGRRGTSIRFAFAVGSVTCVLVSYHTVIHDLTLLLPVVLMLFSAPGTATRSEMRADAGLLMLIYTGLFWGTWFLPWLNPWWWVPVVFWVWRKYGRGQVEALAA